MTEEEITSWLAIWLFENVSIVVAVAFTVVGAISAGSVALYVVKTKYKKLNSNVAGIMTEPNEFIIGYSSLLAKQKNTETLLAAEKRVAQENYNAVVSDLDEMNRRYSKNEMALRAIDSKIDLLTLEMKLTRENQKENQQRLESQIRDAHDKHG